MSRFNAVDGIGHDVSDAEVLKCVKVYTIAVMEGVRELMKTSAVSPRWEIGSSLDEVDAALTDLRNSESGEWADDTWRKLAIAIQANSGMIDALETLAREHAQRKWEVKH